MIMENNGKINQSQAFYENQKGKGGATMSMNQFGSLRFYEIGKFFYCCPLKAPVPLQSPEHNLWSKLPGQLAIAAGNTDRDLMPIGGGSIGNFKQHPFGSAYR